MATLRPHTSSVGSPALQVSTGEDVSHDLEAQSVGRSNIDRSQRNINDTAGGQPTQTGQRPSQAEGAYFFTIAETSLA